MNPEIDALTVGKRAALKKRRFMDWHDAQLDGL